MANTRLRLPPLTRPTARRPSVAARWWVYQRERFPIATHAPLIAAFSFCTLSFSAMARGHVQMPASKAIIVAFATAFIFFLQLRIADEFKDFADDARYRPYRPVPRGLISLRELGVAAIAGALVQLLLALWLSPALLPFLLGVWAYLGLMSREFFVSRWLKAHPATYMWSHMLILPLIDLYGTACDWRVAGAAPPVGLAFLLTVSFCNGFVVEIGRKIRAPDDEEAGVETYSMLWGRPRAVAIWYTALVVTAVFALLAALQIQFAAPAAVLLILLLGTAAVIAARFLRATISRRAKLIELISGVWTLLMYLSLGAVPLIVKLA
jgi:4-hydroxybenzoate polyprenyltransferase